GWNCYYVLARRRLEPVAFHQHRQLANRAGDRLLDDGRAGCALLDARLVVRAVCRIGNAGGHHTGARSGSSSAGRRERRRAWLGYRRLKARFGVDGGDADRGLRGGGGHDRICRAGGPACGSPGIGSGKPALTPCVRIDGRRIPDLVRSCGPHHSSTGGDPAGRPHFYCLADAALPGCERVMNSLEARGVAVARGGRRILDGVNLKVEPGVVMAMAGPNGSGKSTLLRALAGIWPVSDGSVALDG